MQVSRCGVGRRDGWTVRLVDQPSIATCPGDHGPNMNIESPCASSGFSFLPSLPPILSVRLSAYFQDRFSSAAYFYTSEEFEGLARGIKTAIHFTRC